jgi:hypothetical protein
MSPRGRSWLLRIDRVVNRCPNRVLRCSFLLENSTRVCQKPMSTGKLPNHNDLTNCSASCRNYLCRGGNWGLEVSLTKGSRSVDGESNASSQNASSHSFTLRDLYERATISGNSLASELGLYLYTHDETFSSTPKEQSQSRDSSSIVTVHEMALAGIIDVIVSKSESSMDVIRITELPGGVQEWWARMLSGSMNKSQSAVRVPR